MCDICIHSGLKSPVGSTGKLNPSTTVRAFAVSHRQTFLVSQLASQEAAGTLEREAIPSQAAGSDYQAEAFASGPPR